jgi:glycosyltransferase involved in cell wall biosynthesis
MRRQEHDRLGPPGSRKTVALFYGFPLAVGGVESHLLSLVAHGDRSRLRFLFIGVAGEQFRAAAVGLGAELVPWRGPRSQWDLLAALPFARILKENRVDLVHAHSPNGLLQAALAARLRGIPLVASVHLPIQYLVRGHGSVARAKVAVYHLLDRAVLRHLVNRTIFVSSRFCNESIAKRLVFADRATVIRNGIELDRFRDREARERVRLEVGVPSDAVVACFVGRLERQKGLDTLLEALGRLDLEKLNLCLVLVGDGSLKRDLEAQARASGLEEGVRFLSFRNDVEKVLAASDFFVLPSRFDAMPVALIEAMASGLASVVTDVGDSAELVEHGRLGLVVRPDDVGGLAAAVGRLASDAALRASMGREAYHASERYSAAATARQIEDVYGGLLHA